MISIDVFDTAIFRDVYEPTDIFKLVEQQVGSDFYKRRIQAEKNASKLSFYNIDDIYRHLPEFDVSKEIEMEFKHIYANQEILDMYLKNPLDYVFISDMYLPSHIIKKMLSQCGYEDAEVYVSCEEKCNKGSGELFKKVERRLGKITKHYGDNYMSDIVGATKADIEPIYKPALHKLNLQLPIVKNPILKKYAANTLANDDTLTQLAKFYAPLIYDFTKWVLQQRKEGQKIFFLSRDMFMPYVIAHELWHADDVYYLHASRRSLAPMFIHGKEKPLLDKMKVILNDDEFTYKKEKGVKDCMKYLQSMNISDGDIIVDIGYSGSTQRIIEKYLNVKLKGLYIQLDQAPSQFKDMNMTMYLNRFALTYRFLCEFVFTSPEDSLEDYIDGKPYFIPDNEIRKQYAKKMTATIVNKEMFKLMNKMNLSIFDIEQMLIHIQSYPSDGLMKLFNEPILTNREQQERGINFDKELIMKGQLFECYRKSYAKPMFKKLLEQDKELSSLSKLLN